MDSRIKTLNELGDSLFTKSGSIMSLWQEIADNFYPQRADFTTSRSIGQDFAGLLTTSYPIMMREELGSQISTMLRPTSQSWFEMSIMRDDKLDNAGKQWLQRSSRMMRRAMYDPAAQFTRATKEGDQDFATFGQCCLTVELNRDLDTLLYRCWHLRDVRWAETYDGVCMPIVRKWSPTLNELNTVFREKISAKAKTALEKTPYNTWKVRHVIIPAKEYDNPQGGKKWNTEYVSIFYEEETGHVLEEVGKHNKMYVLPRWQTVSGSQYAYSPATVAALPDARLIQAMTLTLLEASEKATNPPMVATQEAVRSDIQIFAGGTTWVDKEYDEKLGEALRPLTMDHHGFPQGVQMLNDTKQAIYQAFYLNKLTMPITSQAKTAYEVSQIIQQYIRQALPLFEPMEMDYNGGVCQETFEVMRSAPRGFGNPQDIPQSIRGSQVKFVFESPLHKAVDKEKVMTFQSTGELLAKAISMDPSSASMVDVKISLRDALEGNGTPASWIRTKEQMKKIEEADVAQEKANSMLGTIDAGAETAKKIGEAATSFQPSSTAAATL